MFSLFSNCTCKPKISCFKTNLQDFITLKAICGSKQILPSQNRELGTRYSSVATIYNYYILTACKVTS